VTEDEKYTAKWQGHNCGNDSYESQLIPHDAVEVSKSIDLKDEGLRRFFLGLAVALLESWYRKKIETFDVFL
jgi:hypothetical protein